MNRTAVIAGNWKMNLRRGPAALLARAVAEGARPDRSVAVILCPPFPYLGDVREAIASSGIGLGAQDCAEEADGAFTGEVSAGMLKDAGCTHAIVGHSERRRLYGEREEIVARKLARAAAAGLAPILCVGETSEERQAGRMPDVLDRQLEGSLAPALSGGPFAFLVAYEPVWAIGTGVTATPAQAQEAHARIRAWLEHRIGARAQEVPILYGGSVTARNAADLLALPEVDGALVGGASLKAEEFLSIVEAARGRRAPVARPSNPGVAS